MRVVEALLAGLAWPILPCFAIALLLRRMGLEVGPREMAALHGLYGMSGGLAAGYLLDGKYSAWLWFPLVSGSLCAAGSLANAWVSPEAKIAVFGGPLRGSLLAVMAGGAIGALAGRQRAQKDNARRES